MDAEIIDQVVIILTKREKLRACLPVSSINKIYVNNFSVIALPGKKNTMNT